jgi:hypothetical protein
VIYWDGREGKRSRGDPSKISQYGSSGGECSLSLLDRWSERRPGPQCRGAAVRSWRFSSICIVQAPNPTHDNATYEWGTVSAGILVDGRGIPPHPWVAIGEQCFSSPGRPRHGVRRDTVTPKFRPSQNCIVSHRFISSEIGGVFFSRFQ